ncbi:hypothetical protein ACSBR2_034137 [Camellia fascicularis]
MILLHSTARELQIKKIRKTTFTDPGIMSKFDFGNKPNSKLELSTNSRKFNELGTATHSSPSSARSSMTGVNSVRKGSEEQTRIDMQMEPPSGRSSCHIVGGILCAAFVHENCRKQDEAADQQGTGEDALYCTLCEAEVFLILDHPYIKLEVFKPL